MAQLASSGRAEVGQARSARHRIANWIEFELMSPVTGQTSRVVPVEIRQAGSVGARALVLGQSSYAVSYKAGTVSESEPRTRVS